MFCLLPNRNRQIVKGWYTAMKNIKEYPPLTCLLLALPLQTAVTEPLQINAAEALPAGGITTTVSDSRFIDAGWMNQNIILTPGRTGLGNGN